MAPGREAISKHILEKIYQWCSKDCHLLWQSWLPSAPPVRGRLITRWGHLHPHGTMLSPSTLLLAPNNFGHVLHNGSCLWECLKYQREASHLLLTQSIPQQMMFRDINSGSDSTLRAKLRPTRSKFQGNWAAPWDNWWSESTRLIPIRPSHPNKSWPAAEEPPGPLSRRSSMSPPDILSGAFWIEAQKTLCVLIWRGKGPCLRSHQDRKGKATISGMEKDSYAACREVKNRKLSISDSCESLLLF